jgi:hypothetical protein
LYELLVLTPANWEDTIQQFLRYKNDTLIRTKSITLDYIKLNYAGNDIQEKIKKAIEQEHRNNKVKYVMLVGDADKFPVRYVKAINTEWGTKWYPSDLYYADLYDKNGNFDDWDYQNDGIYGEIDFANRAFQDTNIDKIDMIPDVAIGRVPSSSQSETKMYLEKVMIYEFCARESTYFNYDSNWAKRALFVVDGDPEVEGGVGPFGDETLSNQYSKPLVDSGFELIKRFKDYSPWNSMSDAQRAAEFTKVINQGVGFVNYFGHGGTGSFSQWYSKSHFPNLINQYRLPIVYATACLTARFHNEFPISAASYEAVNGGNWTGGASPRPEPAGVQPSKYDRDSMAEEFLVKRKTGAVAYIGTTSKIEHGGKSLTQYFFDAYKKMSKVKTPALGELWKYAQTEFAKTDALQGMNGYFAFIHIHKVMMFGDPSLRVGGIRYTPHKVPSIGTKTELLNELLN